MSTARPDLDHRPVPLPRRLTAGIVAYNDGPLLRTAVRSLLDQELPEKVQWESVWVVASGCTDDTEKIAHALAEEDPRVRLVVERERLGKARALQQVFRRATGDALVLLNSDARAQPRAVAGLLEVARGKTTPYAVMARPVVSGPGSGRWQRTIAWMWALHHEFHTELLAEGGGRHLSDELLLLSLPEVPPIPGGIINDGSYFAVWLSQHAGGSWYASDAEVFVRTPSTVEDHLVQRRRIHVGNAQVTSILGVAPASVAREFLARPRETAGVLRTMAERPGGWGHLAELATWESISHGLALWDRLPPTKDHVRWRRIGPVPALPTHTARPSTWHCQSSVSEEAAETRVITLLRVAGSFGTGVDLEELRDLLPSRAPATASDLGRWLDDRPTLGKQDGRRAFAPTVPEDRGDDRRARGRAFRERAEALWSGPLAFAESLVRCVGISGSAAFGEPSPRRRPGPIRRGPLGGPLVVPRTRVLVPLPGPSARPPFPGADTVPQLRSRGRRSRTRVRTAGRPALRPRGAHRAHRAR